MSTFLFGEIVFGPVYSRRLGSSLGINLLPCDRKYCNFDCIYCECGWSNLLPVRRQDLPQRQEVKDVLRAKVEEMKLKGQKPDVITFAGNGEPSMHPDFEGIVADTFALRNEFFPGCRISLLSNSSLIHNPSVRKAMDSIDMNILKLDTAKEDTFQKLNKPSKGISIAKITEALAEYRGRKIIQTLFIRGTGNFEGIDNTGDKEIQLLIEAYRKIQPEMIMIYSFYRDTPTDELVKVGAEELLRIAGILEKEGFSVDTTLE